MEIIHKLFNSTTLAGEWVITIGNFDGYHLGHQALVNQVLADKEKLNAKGGVVTFNPHPKEVLQPHVPFRYIYNNNRKLFFLEQSGLDACFIIPFNLEFASLSAGEFLHNLFTFANIKKIIVGYDFNFGKAREGSASLMAQKAESNGIEFQQLDPVRINDYTVSSTMIRRLLFEGDFRTVKTFLGREWSVTGAVTEGRKLGNTIGFPTMNLEPKVLLPLKKGVFTCHAEIDGIRYNGVCNVGVNPTFDGKTMKVETHVFDFNADTYGQVISVFPVKFLREEKRFNSVEELKDQIQKDVNLSLELFEQNHSL